MTNLHRHLKRWAERNWIGQLSRRDLLQRVLLMAGTVPAVLALLEKIGLPAHAEEMSDVPLATTAVEHTDDADLLRCSFCDKEQNDVRKLIAGPSVFICDECVEVCNDIIADDNRFESGFSG
jgi:hypothetical protein